VSDPRTAIVGAGYDAVADAWEDWTRRIDGGPRAAWCDDLVRRLPAGARVVELGCGGGSEETAVLARHFRLTGVDVSGEQLRHARERIPEADFIHVDFTELELEPGSVDAVAAFYSINHAPRELLASLFARIHTWLGPDGLLLATLGAGDTEAWVGEWLGTTMFFSGFPPETNRRLLHEAGFELLRDELVTIREPEGPATFQWVLAQT
jgi:cyclopropane fatty-acyl-phospholipid synthase-like methyltransferase